MSRWFRVGLLFGFSLLCAWQYIHAQEIAVQVGQHRVQIEDQARQLQQLREQDGKLAEQQQRLWEAVSDVRLSNSRIYAVGSGMFIMITLLDLLRGKLKATKS
jgi:hypothetical protein